MGNRLLNIAAAVSATAFCAIVVVWVAAGSVDPSKQFVSLSAACHISIDARGADARLAVFNDANYGPYRGSILSIVGDPNAPTVQGFGDAAGIYYRMIQWPDGAQLWTLYVSLAYPLMAAAVLPCIWAIRHSRRTQRGFPVESQSAAE